ncbi:hypothetical protein [Paenibacillus sp. J22TS3]|uniref:hypothetical protein n=1 Tax=Paenibacillus sp. J22TS3 TaxID=2807192 RepID=UPI001B2CFA64|nr:hypothetical protein [Paenibacillus sp. J22TS3]GIP23610.1 hypothetical protein J22TS3_38850 [Paenibacillus sp. J22TS3]
MGLFDKIRESFTGQKKCPIEHLESYKRLGEQVYELHVELAGCTSPLALAYMQAARSKQMMADAMLGDALSGPEGARKAIPVITHDQADIWYGAIPDLIIASRQEAAFPGSSRVLLPIRLGGQLEGPSPCPVEHLAGLRRAAAVMEELVADEVEAVRKEKDRFKNVILLYEEARTRKQSGDAIVGIISGGRRVSVESHEDAEKQYWMALSNYIVIAQGLKAPEIIQDTPIENYRTCKLDSNDIWKVTSKRAIPEIRRAGEWEQAVEDLTEHWQGCVITEIEREYETTVEDLLSKGLIQETSYWYCCPFPSVYQVGAHSVKILGRVIPSGHHFVYEYGDDGAPGEFLTSPSFEKAYERQYCED